MSPEELAKYRMQKIENERKETEKLRKADDENKARYDADAVASRKAIEEAVTYLEQVRHAMNGALAVDVVRTTENEIAGINLRLDNVSGEIRLHGPSIQAGALVGWNREYRSYNALRFAQDVTNEKLAGFVKFLVDSK